VIPRLLGCLVVFLFMLACESREEEYSGPYMRVGNYYCMDVHEIVNTCSCDGPRNLPSPERMLYRQVITTSGEGASEITVIGGGLEFPARLGASGNLESHIEQYPYDQSIDAITYRGLFTGTSGVAEYHETMGPVDPESSCGSISTPCHLRLQYENGACCGGGGGYNVITLSGAVSTAGEPCFGGNFADNARSFVVWP
jgi:hypothetical protein